LGSRLRPLLLNCFGGLLERGQFLFPLGGFRRFAPGVVELHQPFEGFRDPARGVEIRGQAGLALLESLATLEQERFGVGVILLGQTDRAKAGDDLRASRWIGVRVPPQILNMETETDVKSLILKLCQIVLAQMKLKTRRRSLSNGIKSQITKTETDSG
jgi:hypothetical protein